MTLQMAITTLQTLQARLDAEHNGTMADLKALEYAIAALEQCRAIDMRADEVNDYAD